MRLSPVWACLLVWPTFPVSAETISCGETGVQVTANRSAYADMTCKAVARAEALFSKCNMPAFETSLEVTIVNELDPNCVALYHCGERRIEVLEPPLMEARRSSEGAFALLPIEDYFQSVIVHELAHASFDDVPCPFENCVVANEYVAYSMQVMALTPEARSAFTARSGIERQITRDELSLPILYLAPGRFAQKAWAHLSQRTDPCGYVGEIMEGSVLLDRDYF